METQLIDGGLSPRKANPHKEGIRRKESKRRTVYVAESLSGRIVGFASGGPRRKKDHPEYEGELYAAYVLH
jgi:hypothetical protein